MYSHGALVSHNTLFAARLHCTLCKPGRPQRECLTQQVQHPEYCNVHVFVYRVSVLQYQKLIVR